jgi:hypothetical protein
MENLYIFYHIPKCGGTTVSRVIDRVYDSSVLQAVDPSKHKFETSLRALRQMDPESISKLRMIRGHQTYGLHKAFQRPCRYITVLREPARRFVSAYYHAIFREPASPLGQRLRETCLTLKQLAEADDEVLGRDYLVRRFAGVPDATHAVDGTAFLELAKRNLASDFTVVGITERMDESVLLVSEMLHWKIRGYRSHNLNKRYSANEVDLEVLKVFRQRNSSDVEFYEFAVSLFEKQMRTVPSFREKLEHFRSTNCFYNRWRDRIDRFKEPLSPVHRLLTRRTR